MASSSNGNVAEDTEETYQSDDEDESVDELEQKVIELEASLKTLKKKLQQRQAKVKAKVLDDSAIQREALNRQKKVTRARTSVITSMYRIMEECGVKAFVFGLVQENGKAVANSSQNLWSWWNNKVQFHKSAPHALIINATLPAITVTSTLRGLRGIRDQALGSILSALLQHCNPPQRQFPLENNDNRRPPWWPKGDEEWWPELGLKLKRGKEMRYCKPHDLNKLEKVAVLVNVIGNISPDFDMIEKLVLNSRFLPYRLSAKDASFWNAVVKHERTMAAAVSINDHVDVDTDTQHVDSEALAVPDRGLKRKRLCTDDTTSTCDGNNPQGLHEGIMHASKRPIIISDLPVEPTSVQLVASKEPMVISNLPVEPISVQVESNQPMIISDLPVERTSAQLVASEQPMIISDLPVEPTSVQVASKEPMIISDFPFEPTSIQLVASQQPMTISDLPVEPTSVQIVASSSPVWANQYEEAASGSMLTPSYDMEYSDEMSWIPQNPYFDDSVLPNPEILQGGLDVQNLDLGSSLDGHDVQVPQNFDHSSSGNDTWTFSIDDMWI